MGDKAGEALFLNQIGTSYRHLGEMQRAIEYDAQSLALRRALGDIRGQGSTLGSMAQTYVALGEPRKALKAAREGLGS